VGPFNFSGEATYSVTATDAAGNTSAPRTGTVTVQSCSTIS
jgi:hypothetical protein